MKHLKDILIFINESFGVASLTTFAVALFGYLAFHRHIEINRQKIVFEHVITFCRSFNRALDLLEQQDTSSYCIIYDEFPKHHSAMLDFIHVLNGCGKRNFKKKWTKYKVKYEEMEKSEFWGEDAVGNPMPYSAGLLKHTVNSDGTTALDADQAQKKELKRLIEDILEAARINR